LTAVDERVALQDEKVELLQKYKKSVMQKIFSQKIRFKDENGNDYPDWKEKKLGDVYGFHRTNSLSRSELEQGDGVKNIHYGDIHKKLPIHLDVSNYDLPTIKNSGHIFQDDDFCKAGDLVIADASEDYADIGKCIEIKKTRNREAVAGLHTFLARPKADMISLGFGGYMLRSSFMCKQIRRIATGVSVLGISKTNFSKLSILLPSTDEQRKVADFVSLIDDKINIEKAKLTEAKKFKKALLQRMFV
jgi:type I restriction enzyme S subunit